jgi:hypothetical protein
MIKKEWDRRRRFWKEFAIWKNGQKDIENSQSDIHLIGEMVDFYLKKHPETKKKLTLQKDYGQGVVQLHKNLSLWRKKYVHH